MKPIEELGISRAPWFYHVEDKRRKKPDWIESRDHFEVCETERYEYHAEQTMADCRLIAAAPDLYEALREAVAELCRACQCFRDADGTCANDKPCFVKRWRAALEKAGGKE